MAFCLWDIGEGREERKAIEIAKGQSTIAREQEKRIIAFALV
jgi:hypothetical protein